MRLMFASSRAAEQIGHGFEFLNSLWECPPTRATMIVSPSSFARISAAISECRNIFSFSPTFSAREAWKGWDLKSRLGAVAITLFLRKRTEPIFFLDGDDFATSIASWRNCFKNRSGWNYQYYSALWGRSQTEYLERVALKFCWISCAERTRLYANNIDHFQFDVSPPPIPPILILVGPFDPSLLLLIKDPFS